MDMFCWNTHKQHKRDFPHIKRRCSSFELRQMAVQQYIKSPTTIISRLDRPTSGVLPIVLGHRLAKTTLWWHGWMIGLGIDGWLEGWIMVYEIAFPPGNLKHPLKKMWFQSDDSKSLHGHWLFHQTSTTIWLFWVPGICTWFLFLATSSLTKQKNLVRYCNWVAHKGSTVWFWDVGTSWIWDSSMMFGWKGTLWKTRW